jgi:hypothetical protein
MSHFAVFVITDEEPTEDVLEAVMGPWHEYECTGVDDKYVVDVDVTDEARESYQRYEVDEKHDTGEEPESFLEWCKSWYGYPVGKVLDGSRIEVHDDAVRVITHTNPNAKWDWWTVGGRFPSPFIPKGNPNTVHQIRWGDVDREAMASRQQARRRAAVADCLARLDQQGVTKEEAYDAWWASAEAGGWQACVKAWKKLDEKSGTVREWVDNLPDDHELAPVRDAIKLGVLLAFRTAFDWVAGVPDTQLDIEAWIEAPLEILAFAVVKDGKWYERGEMGWWAVVKDEKDRVSWRDEVQALFDSLDPDDYITCIDCHI